MRHNSVFILVLLIFLLSCGPQRKLAREFQPIALSRMGNCDSLVVYNTLYINKINAMISIDDEEYEARVSLFYIPDSLFFISAVNAGFEIVRLGVMKDSTVYINRLDKMMFVYRNSDIGFQPPVKFEDLEYLLNKAKLCSNVDALKQDGYENVMLDRSIQNIAREYVFSAGDLSLKRFEFFQKKTSEYVVGEQFEPGSFLIYSNYLVDGLMLKTSGGEVEYDKEININLEVNRNKYETIYL